MKIKHILSFAILLSISFFDLQLALANGDSPTEVENTSLNCTPGQIEALNTKTNTNECTDGVSYCDKMKLKYDSETMSCYVPSQGTILPFTDLSVEQCNKVFDHIASGNVDDYKALLADELGDANGSTIPVPDLGADDRGKGGGVGPVDVLGCGIKTGKMKLWMIPYYIKYLLQFVLSVAGIVAVGAMVFGGYLYMFGTVMDDKEKGKRSVMYGIMGFVVVLLAWAIVNVVISLATM